MNTSGRPMIKKLRLYTIVKHDNKVYDWTEDKEFIAELEKRSGDLQSDKVKSVLWGDAKIQISARPISEK